MQSFAVLHCTQMPRSLAHTAGQSLSVLHVVLMMHLSARQVLPAAQSASTAQSTQCPTAASHTCPDGLQVTEEAHGAPFTQEPALQTVLATLQSASARHSAHANSLGSQKPAVQSASRTQAAFEAFWAVAVVAVEFRV